MKKLLTIISCILSISNMYSQETYYYKLTKRVHNDIINQDVTGGQFITFTDKACYESDKSGFSVEHGRLDYKYSENGVKAYVGGSYWGNHSVFLFKSDYSALNVKTENGDTYVYKRASAPTNVTTCSLIKDKKSHDNYDSSPSYFPITSSFTDYHTNNSISNNDENHNNRTKREQRTKHKCLWCNGIGRVVIETKPPMFGQPDYKVRCSECGEYFLRSWGHAHVTCGHCGGKGYSIY